MSNIYLCEVCRYRRDSIPNEICPYRLTNAGMLVRYSRQDPKEVCIHYKWRGDKECR